MNPHKILILVEAESIFEDDTEASSATGEMIHDIEAYLESMKHALEPIWRDCASITVSGSLNIEQVKVK